MKRYVISLTFGILAVFLFVLTGCTDNRAANGRLVDFGSTEYEEEAGIRVIEPEEPFLAENFAVSGLPTIIEFGAKGCTGTRLLNTHFKQFLKLRPDVAVRQVYLPDDWQPQEVYDKYQLNVGSIPHIIIFGPDGELIVEDKGRDKKGFDFLYKWMNDEIQLDWKARNAG